MNVLKVDEIICVVRCKNAFFLKKMNKNEDPPTHDPDFLKTFITSFSFDTSASLFVHSAFLKNYDSRHWRKKIMQNSIRILIFTVEIKKN